MKTKHLLLTALLVGIPSVYAAEVNIRGFASFMGGMTSSSDEQYSGYDNHFNFSPESLAAIQFDANLDEGLSATVQLVGRGVNGYDPTVEWAYMGYDLTDNLRLNAGRLRIPFYRFSDSLDVRYTYPWVEAPEEVYGIPFGTVDGVSLFYNGFIGDFETSVQAVFGQYDGTFTSAGDSPGNIEDLMGLAWSLSNSWLYLRAAYVKANVEVDVPDLDPLLAGVDEASLASGYDFSSVTSAIKIDGDVGAFGGIAVGIDHNNFLFDAEVIQYVVEDALVPKADGYFVSLGYRFDKFTPYILISKLESTTENKASKHVPQFMPALAQGISYAFEAAENEKEAVEIGFRYDFHDLAAFKASYMMRDDQNAGEVDVIRAGVDLVF